MESYRLGVKLGSGETTQKQTITVYSIFSQPSLPISIGSSPVPCSLLMAGSHEKRSCFSHCIVPRNDPGLYTFSLLCREYSLWPFNHSKVNPSLWQFSLFPLQLVLPGTRSAHMTFPFLSLSHLTNSYQSHQEAQQHSPNYKLEDNCKNFRKYTTGQ